MGEYRTAAGRSDFFYTYAAENPASAWTSGSHLRSTTYPGNKVRSWPTENDRLITPLHKTLDQDLSGVSRTYMECRIGLIDAYAKTFGLDVGSYYVGLAPEENVADGTLFRRRLDDYNKLCVKEHLGLTFEQYLSNPRYKIVEYNLVCTAWSTDPNTIAKREEENAKKLLGG